MTTHSPAVTRALAEVDEDTFVRRPDGNLVSQSSSQPIIANLIDRLNVQPGMKVLEIGTGSGYSTALLAHLAADGGHVVSVDVVAELVDRARQLLTAHGHSNTTLLHGDGIQGAPGHGPFDRVIAWTTAPHLPAAWTTQLSPDGAIVAPLTAAPISKSGLGAHIRLGSDASPVADQLFAAGFVELSGVAVDQWLVPPYGIDVLRHDDKHRPWWLSGEWIRSPRHYLDGRYVLDALIQSHDHIPGPLQPDESAADWRAWLLATRPAGLTTAALGEPLWRIGHTHQTGAALTDARTATQTVITSANADAEVLTDWADAWRAAGRPGLTDLVPHLEAFHDGWVLRTTAPR
ncbi:methyltransferase domain-containing protein [Lentzea tibetensis]|uniref:Protein-L-isoaspartate O-methyltransferase n=1 Tax=Lentzea tibetensis TaxID=2591470 RepID=A0A563EID8_9PSEU|nr:methyltransferase domain-containing protein [Lentzea tibetensis]TWP46080.1 methyltransferase domain-containing protein [Lentzea tibetensis]